MSGTAGRQSDPARSTGPLKVVVLAPVHIYDDIRVFRKEATTLAEAGMEVVLYARTPDDEPLHRNGVRVEPIRPTIRPLRFAKLLPLGIRALREKADVYHLHNPDTLPIGFALRMLGKRVVYDTHEDFAAEILLRQWIPGPLRRSAARLVAALEALAGRTFALTIVTQEQIRRRIPQAIVIGNPPLLDEETARALAAAREKRAVAGSGASGSSNPTGLRLGYVGGISKDRGLNRMLELLDALNPDTPTRLTLIGPAVNDDALAEAQRAPVWQHVDHLGPLPQEEAFAELESVDAGLILFEDTASHRYIDPNKIYEYLSLSIPFIATDFAGWRDRFAGWDVGLFLPADLSADQAAQRVRAFVADRSHLRKRGRNGIEYLATVYSWGRSGAPELIRAYRSITGSDTAASPRGDHSAIRSES